MSEGINRQPGNASRERPPEAANDNGFESLRQLSPAEVRTRLKAVVVDVEDLAEKAARDRAERSLTESAQSVKGIKGFFKKMWKHGLAREYYRQAEIARARTQIHEKGNIYATEDPAAEKKAHDEAMKAVLDRFSSEYEETLHKDEKGGGETRRKLGERMDEQRAGSEAAERASGVKRGLESIVKDYARGAMDDASFLEAKVRLLSSIKEGEDAKKDSMYADNFLELAKQAKQAVEHGVALDKLDIDFNITVGKAKDNLKTEANYNFADKIIDKLNHSPVGRVLNGSTIAMGTAAIIGAAGFISKRLISSRFAALISFGGTAAASGLFLGLTENKRMKEDRRQHARERAQGRTFEKDSPRREEMEKYLYEMRDARELSAGILSTLYGPGGKENPRALTPEDAQVVMQRVAEIEARLKLMDRHKIDLLAYSDSTKIEQERLDLDLARAQAKVELRKLPGDLAASLAGLTNIEMNRLMAGEAGIRNKDAMFQKMKFKKVLGRAFWGSLVGLGVGAVGQEVAAYWDPNQTGFAEHLTSGMDPRTENLGATPLESGRLGVQWLAHYISGEGHLGGPTHDVPLGDMRITLPESLTMHADGHGGYALMDGNNPVIEHLKFDQDGVLTPDSQKLLADNGFTSQAGVDHTIATSHANLSASDYLKNHPELKTHHIHRDLWYDNDTPHPFDKNELNTWWGGKGNTGIDENDNYTFTVNPMTIDGSSHGDQSANARELFKQGNLKMLLSVSQGTQAHVIEVPIEPDGTIHIKPDSPEGKLLFEKDAKGHAHFKGRFAEIAQMMGKKDGVDHVRILGTYEGKGLDDISDVVKKVCDTPHTIITQPDPLLIPEPPPIVPIYYRTPLEPVTALRRESKPITEARSPFTGAPYYGGFQSVNGLWAEMKKSGSAPDPYFEKVIDGKKVWVDKEGNPVRRDAARENARIKSYFDSQEKGYMDELRRYATQVGSMDEKCRLAVIVPARFEEKNLAILLDQYARQTDEQGNPVDPATFEVNVIVNRKEGEAADKSIEIINTWKAAHPGYRVNAIDVVFSKEKANVGNARKYITDLALLRSSERANSAGPLYIESEDADVVSLDRRTVSKLVKSFDERPQLDILRGVQDRQPEVLQQNELLFFERRLWDITETFMRRLAYRPENMQGSSFVWNRVVSGGWNTAFTAESYAQIGGYVPDLIAEDMKVGWKVSLLRGTQNEKGEAVPNTRTATGSGLRASSSPRRFLDAMNKNIGPYDDFDNQDLKHKSIDELLEGVKQYAKATEAMKPIYEDTLNRLGSFIREQLPLPEARRTFGNTLMAMGLRNDVDYTSRSDGSIALTDSGMPRIIYLMQRYKDQNRAEWGYRRQTSQLAGSPESTPTPAPSASADTQTEQAPDNSPPVSTAPVSPDVTSPAPAPRRPSAATPRTVRAQPQPLRASPERRSAPRPLTAPPNPTTQNRRTPGNRPVRNKK